jgi:6-phosphogluconolactonase
MVPGSDVNSNFTLASSTLLTHVPIPFGQIHRIRTEAGDAAAVAAAYEAELRGFFPPSLGEWPRFDLILLGMGPDGHVASLFPDRPALAESIRWVVASSPGLPPPVTRVTLTLPVLNAAAAVAFLVSGSDKAPALRRALAGDERLPAARVKPVNGTLRWFVDSNAAGHA